MPAVGKKADLVLLDTKSKSNALIDISERVYVIKNGRVTVKSENDRNLTLRIMERYSLVERGANQFTDTKDIS